MREIARPPLASDAELAALQHAAKLLGELPGIVKVVLFGSRARGDFSGSSDMDILVVVEGIAAKDKVVSTLHDLELEYDVPLAPVIMTENEYRIGVRLGSGFLENVGREGMVLHETERWGQGRTVALPNGESEATPG